MWVWWAPYQYRSWSCSRPGSPAEEHFGLGAGLSGEAAPTKPGPRLQGFSSRPLFIFLPPKHQSAALLGARWKQTGGLPFTSNSLSSWTSGAWEVPLQESDSAQLLALTPGI